MIKVNNKIFFKKVNAFVASYNYNFLMILLYVILGIFIVFKIYSTFLVTLLMVATLLHSLISCNHILEDYVFNTILRTLFIFLVNVVALKLFIVIIC